MNYGTGCLRTPDTIKQNHFVLKSQTPKVIDWDKGFLIDGLETRNQGQKSDCTGQATAYYGEAKNKIINKKSERYSADYIYSQVYQPDGGAYIWQAMSIPVKQGYASLSSVFEPQTEEEARNVDREKAIIEAIAEKYAQIPSKNIDYLAQIIEDFNGFVGGFEGNNSIVQTSVLSIPDKVDWGHAIYICGYKKINNQKVLIFKNSWGNWGDNSYGYIPEEFVKSNYFFDAYVYAGIKDIETMYTLVRNPHQIGDIYAIIGNSKRKIRGLDDLRAGRGLEWQYNLESDIIPMDTLTFDALTLREELTFLTPDEKARAL